MAKASIQTVSILMNTQNINTHFPHVINCNVMWNSWFLCSIAVFEEFSQTTFFPPNAFHQREKPGFSF